MLFLVATSQNGLLSSFDGRTRERYRLSPLGAKDGLRSCVSKLLSDFKACPNESAIGNAHEAGDDHCGNETLITNCGGCFLLLKE
jgi:hypothetical protein